MVFHAGPKRSMFFKYLRTNSCQKRPATAQQGFGMGFASESYHVNLTRTVYFCSFLEGFFWAGLIFALDGWHLAVLPLIAISWALGMLHWAYIQHLHPCWASISAISGPCWAHVEPCWAHLADVVAMVAYVGPVLSSLVDFRTSSKHGKRSIRK